MVTDKSGGACEEDFHSGVRVVSRAARVLAKSARGLLTILRGGESWAYKCLKIFNLENNAKMHYNENVEVMQCPFSVQHRGDN